MTTSIHHCTQASTFLCVCNNSGSEQNLKPFGSLNFNSNFGENLWFWISRFIYFINESVIQLHL